MRETILVADPNIEFLDQTRAILEKQSYQCLQAMSGGEARLKLEQDEIDFLLVNTSLPEVDGASLCQFVREELLRPIPVALMVGQGSSYPPPETLDLADGLLVRPMRPQELLNCLHHLRVVRYFMQQNYELHSRLMEVDANGGVVSAVPVPQEPPPAPEPIVEEAPTPVQETPVPVPAAPPPRQEEPGPDDTPLYPMTWFRKLAALEVKRAIRFHHPLSLLLMAYDLTEEFLEATPPDMIEALSQALATSVRASIRDIDIPVQFSRDHILILLPNTDIEGSISAASRVKLAVTERLLQELPAAYGHPPSISIGATTSSVQGNFKFTDLLRDATRALREVRAQGGDGVFYC